MRVEIFLLFLGLSQLCLGTELIEDEGNLIKENDQFFQAVESVGRSKRQTHLTCAKPVSHAATYPADCADIKNWCTGLSPNASSGIYEIQPYGASVFKVYCDMETDGGGWTVFQRRMDGTIDFYRSWSAYQLGFGNLNTEYWLGNDNIHYLTSQTDYELRVDMTNSLGNKYYAKYDKFRIGDDFSEYFLVLGDNYSGTAGDSLSYHDLRKFSTYDNDNDDYTYNCAHSSYRRGAWWFRSCSHVHLNGNYYGYSSDSSVYWYLLPGDNDNIQFVEMKLRPK